MGTTVTPATSPFPALANITNTLHKSFVPSALTALRALTQNPTTQGANIGALGTGGASLLEQDGPALETITSSAFHAVQVGSAWVAWQIISARTTSA